jgi:hypothetical protein
MMTSLEQLQLAAKAAEYEALYLRAREASRGHQVGLERVLRRLRRVCAVYGSEPQFIAASATIARAAASSIAAPSPAPPRYSSHAWWVS